MNDKLEPIIKVSVLILFILELKINIHLSF